MSAAVPNVYRASDQFVAAYRTFQDQHQAAAVTS